MVYQVLIADDCRMIRQMFGEMLKNAGDRYSLAGTAENAEQAVAFCRSHPVDLVIMDVVMSTGKDGIESFWHKELQDAPLLDVMHLMKTLQLANS